MKDYDEKMVKEGETNSMLTSIKSILIEYLSNTSTHGIPNLFRRRHILVKYCGCFALLLAVVFAFHR